MIRLLKSIAGKGHEFGWGVFDSGRKVALASRINSGAPKYKRVEENLEVPQADSVYQLVLCQRRRSYPREHTSDAAVGIPILRVLDSPVDCMLVPLLRQQIRHKVRWKSGFLQRYFTDVGNFR